MVRDRRIARDEKQADSRSEIVTTPRWDESALDYAARIRDIYREATMTITETYEDQRAPLHYRYPQQIWPQPAYVEIDPEERTICAGYSPEIGNSCSAAVWNGLIYHVTVSPEIMGFALDDLLLALVPHAERLAAGWTSEWDGSNYRGRLDESAQDMLDKITRLCESVDDLATIVDVDDALAPVTRRAGDEITVAEYTISAVTTDAELAAMAAGLTDGADSNDIVLDGDIDAYLIDLRDELSA